jgi:hypothetical protein
MITEDNAESVVVELTEREFLALARAAHDRDITFNQLCNEIIRKELDAADRGEEER